jgi:hypothetical protein
VSETAPERTGGGGGNFWTRKLGPLPAWGWAGIVLLAVLGYSYFKNKNSASSSSSADTSGTAANTPGGVDASLVPQFVNQVYTQTTPPAAPNVTVNNQLPPTAPPAPVSPPTTTPPPKQAPTGVHQYPAPSGLTTSKVSPTSLKVSWKDLTSPQPAPASYTVAIYQGSKVVSQETINAPDSVGGNSTATITGLPSNAKNLQVHVWANGGALAPPHASSTVSLLCQSPGRIKT